MNLFKILNPRNTGLLFYIFKSCTPRLTNQSNCWFSSLSKLVNSPNVSLKSYSPIVVPSCGMKVKGQLRLRCKNCYFERKDGQLYVKCTSYPRHKQQALRKRAKYSWILTHCFQSKQRPY